MFTELKELLRYRSLTITVAVLENEQMRVNVVPHTRPDDTKTNKQISYSHKNEVASVPEEALKALTTPISITGAAEEIDQQLPGILAQYVESHLNLQASLDRASSEIAEAVKAIDERNKAKTKEKAAKNDEKVKKEEPQPKADDTLPLWWTDKSAVPPGMPQPQLATETAVSTAVPAQATLPTQIPEEVEQQ